MRYFVHHNEELIVDLNGKKFFRVTDLRCRRTSQDGTTGPDSLGVGYATDREDL